ncbi:right-handed parallel beta-helix repeat-containing protein [Flavobacterium alkalisoli]|uniref:right-handed parallel beta-helix repeat-containing protein n=1 Tax=Flavobacterium alkalisoli TaxID=2602769 RepID=UPI003A904861
MLLLMICSMIKEGTIMGKLNLNHIEDIYVRDALKRLESTISQNGISLKSNASGNNGKILPVTSFGADSTGSSSSNNAVRLSIDSQGFAYFPKGTYLLSDCIIESNVIIYGEGTIIKDADANFSLVLSGDNITVKDIKFETQVSNTITPSGDIRLADSAKRINIKDCFFNSRSIYCAIGADSNGGDDSSLMYSQAVESLLITNCKFLGSYSRHLYLHSIHNLTINGNFFEGTNYDAIRLRQGIENCIISNNQFKNIGLESEGEFEQRPDFWVSIETFSLGDIVSVPPYGIYECIVATSTLGANPATSGSSEWKLLNNHYFSTKDAIDTYWSGRSLIISNNIIDKTASVGFDIKGVEPTGKYATRNIIITGNLIKNTFGRGIFLNNSGPIDYVATGEVVISNNVIEGCNRERYDISEGAIHLRSGLRNVIISNNIIQKNYGRGINLFNLDDNVPILKNISVLGNTIMSNGMAGDLSSIGLYITPVDGLIVKDNFISNHDSINEYIIDCVTGQSTTGTLSIPTRVSGVTLDIDYDPSADHDVLIDRLNTQLKSKVFQDLETYTKDYFGNFQTYGGDIASAEDSTSSVLFKSINGGSPANDITIILRSVTGSNIYPQPDDYSWDSITKTLTIDIRASSTQAFHLVATYISAPQEARDLIDVFEVINGNNNVILGRPNGQTEVIQLSGASSVYSGVDAKLANMLNEGEYTDGDVTFTITKNKDATNSNQVTGIYFNQETPLGDAYYQTPPKSAIISNNNCAGNNLESPRFNIMLDGQEPPVLIAYVASGNDKSSSIVTTMPRTMFSGGSESNSSTHLATRSILTFQGITLSSVEFGTNANNISLTIVRSATWDSILSVTVAPYVFKGSEIIVSLPLDEFGNPVDVTVGELVIALRKELGNAILDFSGNYIGHQI